MQDVVLGRLLLSLHTVAIVARKEMSPASDSMQFVTQCNDLEYGIFGRKEFMLRKSILAVLAVLLLGPAWSALAGYDPALAVYWPLDDGAGTIAHDPSGHGANGTISAGPTWVNAGKVGAGVLQFTGAGDVRGPHIAMNTQSFTIAFWMNPTLPASGSQIMFSEVQSSTADLSMHLRIGGLGQHRFARQRTRFGFYSDDLDSPANVFQSGTWYHLTFWYDWPSKARRIYINGVQVANNTSAAGFQATTGVHLPGLLDRQRTISRA